MDEYANLIWILVALAILGARLAKWLRDQTGMAGPRGERRARLPGIDEEPPEYVQTWKGARERGIPTQAPMTLRPEGGETKPRERKGERSEVPPGETPTDIRKVPSSRPSRLFRDSDDLRRAVIWSEVLRRPVPRKLR
jgi:hypothetical protein